MTDVFDIYAADYDAWFDHFPWVYQSEVAAVRSLLAEVGRGVEIGVGSGRFASALGIPFGVEPSPAMAVRARDRGIQVVRGRAECLPLDREAFDTVLLVTVLCFLPEPIQALQEATRVLKPGGRLVIAFLDPGSPQGRVLTARQEESRFFRRATFRQVTQVAGWLTTLGYRQPVWRQTIFQDLTAITALEPVRNGWGEGLFVVVAAVKP